MVFQLIKIWNTYLGFFYSFLIRDGIFFQLIKCGLSFEKSFKKISQFFKLKKYEKYIIVHLLNIWEY